MATTGKVTINSNDLTSDNLNLNTSITLKTTVGDDCTITSGVQRISIAAGASETNALAITQSYIQGSTASATLGTNWHKNYLYIKNVNPTAEQGHIHIYSDGGAGNANMDNSGSGITCEEGTCDACIALLEKDDWMVLPWPAYANLIITNMDASNETLVEFMIVG